jgi:23S rRNA (cytosine1962-C5)-methyltransferase
MLHARRLALPSVALDFEAELPEAFSDWLNQRVTLGSSARARRALLDAACLRYSLPSIATTYRWVNDAADDMPGVTIDRYADWAVLFLASDEALARETELAELCVALGTAGVYVKRRPRGDLRTMPTTEVAPAEPIAGDPAPSPLTVTERELRFDVELADGLSSGLFLDQRDNRALIRGLSSGARVLNLFSYTGSFSVAAAAGGAAGVTSVDLSARALERAKENLALNGLDREPHRFVKADAFEWLTRAARKGERFDVIVLDPPSFGTRSKRSTFNVSRDFGRLATRALALLDTGGRLLAVTNHRKTSLQRLRRLLRGAARESGVEIAQLKDLPTQLDCPDGPDGPLPSKSVLLTASRGEC